MSDITSFSATVDINAYRGATKLAKLAKGRGRNPYLKARVAASCDGLTITATDADLTITASIPATVTTAGDMFVDAAWLLGNVPKGRGTVDLIGNEVSWSLRNGVTATGPALTFDDTWPVSRTESAAGAPFLIPTAILSAAYEVAAAASTDDVRPILNAVYFDGFNVVATDSYRLHAVNHGCDAGPLAGCLIPLRVIRAAQAVGGVTVAVSEDKRRVTFAGPDGIVTGHLTEGAFPKWQALRAARSDLVAEVMFADRAAVSHILVDMERVSKASSNGAPVRITRSSPIGQLELTVMVDGAPAIAATVAGDLYGDAVDALAFSPKFLRGVLDGTGAGPATLRGKSALSPWELSWHDADCAEHFRLLMPVRVY